MRPAPPRSLRATTLCVLLTACGAIAAAPPAQAVDWGRVQEEATGLLQRYVRIRSVNPPADTREAAAFLESILREEGIPVETFEPAPGRVNLLARIAARSGRTDAAAKPVMLLHHMDVVPVDPDRWPGNPFSGEVADGHLHGRGAVDMKGLGIVHLMAFLTLHRNRVPLTRDLLLLATADEETGGEWGARWMIGNHWEKMDPEYVFDEGGFGSRDVISADGRLTFGVAVAEKKILWIRVTVRGTAGHGSQPLEDNPNVLLARVLAAIAARPDVAQAGPVVREMEARLGALADNKFTRAIRRDTVSLTTLRSGVGDPPKVNVIPSLAQATIDCRLLPETDVDAFLADLRALAPDEGRLEIETIYRMDDTPVTPHDTPMFAALERAILARYPGATVTPMMLPYGTDSNTFRVRGARAYGINPMILDASIVASMHSDAERVPVAGLGDAVRVFHDLLRGCCAAPAP